jgi:RNA polymerase sigma-70 factor (ECF subfamily)
VADEASYVRQVSQHAGAVLRVATALVGHDDAEDAAQEALTRAWRAWGTLRATNAARSWLLRITVNVCREWLRGSLGASRRMVQPLPDDTQTAVLFDLYTGTSDHTGALYLRAAVNELPGEQRLVVALRFYGGMRATEIAEALDVPAATVRTRLHRALITLRTRLAPSDGRLRSTPRAEGGW